VSLCRPRRLSPAALAGRRTNVLKSIGPRTFRGKARVGLNALRLGLHARPKVLVRRSVRRSEMLDNQPAGPVAGRQNKAEELKIYRGRRRWRRQHGPEQVTGAEKPATEIATIGVSGA